MRCNDCPACFYSSYEEGEPDFGCLVGVNDRDKEEFKDLSVGCRIPRNKIERMLREIQQQRKGKKWEEVIPIPESYFQQDHSSFEMLRCPHCHVPCFNLSFHRSYDYCPHCGKEIIYWS